MKYYDEFLNACHSVIIDKDCSKYFKVYENELPRVSKVIGFLKGINPNNLLDIGSGRGRSLWPISYHFKNTNIVCIDKVEWRHKVINAVSQKISRIKSINLDISQQKIPFDDCFFDVTLALEVIEHILDFRKALEEIYRVTNKFIVISVPSKKDNNPDHLWYFTEADFERELNTIDLSKKIKKINFEYVRNSLLVYVSLRSPNDKI